MEGNYWSDYTGVDDGSGTGKHAIAGDGKYDDGIDALDDEDIKVTAGFFVIPEYPLGGILSLVTSLAVLAAFKSKRAGIHL